MVERNPPEKSAGLELESAAPRGAVPTHSTVQVIGSRGFVDWLADQQISLAFTTYQSNKLFLIGRRGDGRLSAFERTFARCMGLWSDGQTIWLTSQFQVWRLENVLAADQTTDGFDRLYVPRVGYVTGDVDAHDIALPKEFETPSHEAPGTDRTLVESLPEPSVEDARPLFVNTLFSCLATVSERDNFQPLWRPPFISKLAAEDRCHLNGLAMEKGSPRYVTACSQSDVVDGWRDRRVDGGCVLDVAGGEVVVSGLSMPHSPRLHRGRLWLLNSGYGEFGWVDSARGVFDPVAFCPGYARGLAMVDKYAVIGLSRPREQTFQGLPLDGRLAERQAAARCGLLVVDLDSGDVLHWLRLEGMVQELYDVAVLPGVVRPKALGFKTHEIRRNVWFHDDGRAVQWIGAEKEDTRELGDTD